ncbi:RNA polymerase sigma-70 factor (ECF subfamily) [Diaminobutyricimonas aerilata]|uniref:RNA polymerase sigma-70 factor (ECF subfamily) n=1 Tax=Diaminobutyricimonas aerilata TaxID=1162967 RepID=A0A2M9CJ66_9MICO|nr:DUF6596 domain-containing protein [Diaminobutyricimonas aerilata]PJJ71939.1 RNA polymerase sigma-70 factor (ECF subfamily) [Diaminobutyricimonas aerilata]
MSDAIGPAEVLALVLREEWGRLLALLAAGSRRLDLAEDALADAFEAAARTWPVDGAPAQPAAWLLIAARRRLVDRVRAEAVAARTLPLLRVDAELHESARAALTDPVGIASREEGGEVKERPIPDERLRLVVLCAHPSLPRHAAAALTLRLVLGISTDDLARLFLVRPSTMAARLTRARKALATQSLRLPGGRELAERIAVVADIAYLAFTSGYAPGSGVDALRADVAGEAIRLVRVVRQLLDGTHEADSVDRSELDALLALLLLQHARRDARVRDGRLVLLPEQDRSLWRTDETLEALALLTPLAHAPAAPYLLQALIAAEHAIAPSAAETAWERIVQRYDELVTLTDSPVVRLNRAVAIAELRGPEAGLAELDALPPEHVDALTSPGHRFPAVRAELLARAGRPTEAVAAYDDALARCANDAEREHLTRRRSDAVRARHA